MPPEELIFPDISSPQLGEAIGAFFTEPSLRTRQCKPPAWSAELATA